jgi:hypothetical protein
MATPRGYGNNGQALYTNVTKPMATWVQFTVTPTNGTGITSLKSNGYCNYAFMHTSTTPSATNGITNPNPPNGYAIIGLKNNFNAFLGYRWNIAYPATSTGTTSVTANSVYTITALGTATTAQWQAVGLPAWLTPAVGQTFVATASQSIGGSATVGVPGVPNVSTCSLVGSADATIASSNIAQYGGAYLLLQFGAASSTFTGDALAAHSHALLLKNAAVADGATTRVNAGTNLLGANTGSDITVAGGGANGGVQTTSAGTPAGTIASTFAATAPTTGAIVRLELFYDGSTVTIDGL